MNSNNESDKTSISEVSENKVTSNKNRFKGDVLFDLHKVKLKKRDDLFKQGCYDKIRDELEGCTFHPKISQKFHFGTDLESLNVESFNKYVEKMKKVREDPIIQSKPYNRKLELTIPEENRLNTSRISKYSNLSSRPMRVGSNLEIKHLINSNKKEGIKIIKPMKYDNAVGYLRNILQNMDI